MPECKLLRRYINHEEEINMQTEKGTNKSGKLNNVISTAENKSKNNCASFLSDSQVLCFRLLLLFQLGSGVTCVFYYSGVFKLVIRWKQRWRKSSKN